MHRSWCKQTAPCDAAPTQASAETEAGLFCLGIVILRVCSRAITLTQSLSFEQMKEWILFPVMCSYVRSCLLYLPSEWRFHKRWKRSFEGHPMYFRTCKKPLKLSVKVRHCPFPLEHVHNCVRFWTYCHQLVQCTVHVVYFILQLQLQAVYDIDDPLACHSVALHVCARVIIILPGKLLPTE